MPTLIDRRKFATIAAAAAMIPAARAADMGASKDVPDLTKVRAAIKVKNYDAAVAELKGMLQNVNYQHPDVYSLLGFALRKSGDRVQAMTYYRKALDADPTHRGALEYQGELYVELGQIDKAKENLAKLSRLCWFGCEEEGDLKEAIADATRKK
jgi:tetratricopeptide (TPR) repeat protein